MLDRILAVLRGVANILLLGLANLRKALANGGQNAGGIVHAQGGLGDHGQLLALARLHGVDIGLVLDQVDALQQLAHGAFHLGVAFVANHEELLLGQLGHFNVDLGHQRAGGIKNAKAPALGLLLHGLAHAVGREHQGGTGWHLGQVFDEDRAARFQVIDHIGVVHNFMAHVDGGTKFEQRPLDDLDRTIDPGAKAARLGQENFFGLHHLK